MTNTLHRYGDEHSLRNDFIVFAIPCRGHNDQDSVPKLRQFLRMAVKYNPVNIGDGSKGGMYRPNKSLNPLAHWSRDSKPDIEEVVEKVSNPTTVAAVFDNKEAVENLFRRSAKRIWGSRLTSVRRSKMLRHAAATSTCPVTVWNIHWVSSGRPTAWPTGRFWSCPRCADTE